MESTEHINRNYKDTIFRMLFRNRKELLELYNALNDSSYSDPEDLEIRTLEDAVYMKFKNDVSFLLHSDLFLYEHQSTKAPNMPLRMLFYVADLLQGIVPEEKLYSRSLYPIPEPHFVVFYNGRDSLPETSEYTLSSLYEKNRESRSRRRERDCGNPMLELKVTVLNINWGMNKNLMERCATLSEYAQFINLVRQNSTAMPISEAVDLAIDTCIRNGILKEFLERNRKEVRAVSIYEFDEKKFLAMEKAESWEEGRAEGRKEGREEGKTEGRYIGVIETMLDDGKTDQEILNRLTDKYGLAEEEANHYIKKTRHLTTA